MQDCLGRFKTLTDKIQQNSLQLLESFLMPPLPSPAWGWHKGTCARASAVLMQRLTASLKSPTKVCSNKTPFLYWSRSCMGIHFLLSILLKGDNLLQRDHNKQLGSSNILKHLNCLLSEAEWKPLNQSQVLILSFFDFILSLKMCQSYFSFLYGVISSSNFYSTFMVSLLYEC